jgi:trk system potassium uptake protein TrkA
MKILIIGAGKLGQCLARSLAAINNDITVLDTDEAALDRIGNNIDALTIKANGVELLSLTDITVKEYDLTITVTGSDETNIISAGIAKKLGCTRVIARIRNPEFVRQKQFIQELMGIDYAVNPELAIAREIERHLLDNHNFYSSQFAEGRISVLDLPSSSVPHLHGRMLKDIDELNGLLVLAISRSGTVIVPNGSSEIGPEDTLYIVGQSEKISSFIKRDDVTEHRDVRRVMVIGGGRVAYYLASNLSKRGIRIKIVENDPSRCERLSELLPDNVMVLYGDGADLNLLLTEDLESMDAFVGATGYDEENLLMTLTAKQYGVNKVVAKVSKPNYINILERLGVDTAISTLEITASDILKFVRGGSVLAVAMLLGGQAEVVELLAQKGMKILGTPLKDIKLPQSSIIGAIVRQDEVIIPSGDTVIMEDDRVIIFCLIHTLDELEKLFITKHKGGFFDELLAGYKNRRKNSDF